MNAPATSNARTWEMLCHLTALAGLVGVPLGNILGPLVIWLIKKDEIPGVDAHGKESLNFQLSITLYSVIAGLLMFVFVGIFLLIALMILDLVFVIIASIKANEGVPYQYPMTIRFLK
jgi:uncharacterized Tic20 family protein